MKQKNELGAMLMAAALLLLCVSYMTQCSAATRRPDTVAAATPSASTPVSREEEVEREAEHKPKSIHEFAAEEENEERAKIKGISRALQTIAADPELRRTYGFDK
jgi:hypothetical protein